MKIDLRRNKGILAKSAFRAMPASGTADGAADAAEQTEDERIAEIMRRRLKGTPAGDTETSAPEADLDRPTATKPLQKKSGEKPKNNPWRLGGLLVILIIVLAYYLHTIGLLTPYVDQAEEFWNTRIKPLYSEVDSTLIEDSLAVDGLLSEDVFNQLMPVTEDLAALKDSIQDTPLAEAIVPLDSMEFLDSVEGYTEIIEAPVQLSEHDIVMLNNRSLLLMLIDVISAFPEDLNTGRLFLKRDALALSAPRGGSWVEAVHTSMDKFVLGSFNEDYSKGRAEITSKFEIIMKAEHDFQPQILDALRLLDVLAHPFNDYLQEIIIDFARGTDDNPASISFVGTAREIQYVVSSWAESRCNFLLRSAELVVEGGQYHLTLDVEFFNYLP